MKANVSITKNAVVSVGNYNTVKPEVNITITDVNIKNIDKVTKLISELTHDLWVLEFNKLFDEIQTINNITALEYYKEIEQSTDEIQKNINKNMKEIKKITDE
jgi:MoaA/NifB/PqqE/SkfB family radical SAM enzyme